MLREEGGGGRSDDTSGRERKSTTRRIRRCNLRCNRIDSNPCFRLFARSGLGQPDDGVLGGAVDGAVWFADESCYRCGVDDGATGHAVSCDAYVAQFGGEAVEGAFNVDGEDGGVVGGRVVFGRVEMA